MGEELVALSSFATLVFRRVGRKPRDTMLSKRFLFALGVLVAAACIEAREEGPHDMADALRMLQELDRYYTQASRPRFGKRSEVYSNWGKDLEKPDLPAWLAYARRR
ncbi:unnamed protein product [Pieris brassicae]|uniref:Neuropeptide F n=1 Tax=Pieris brassicae TaxID=7116 RepID=A0A9P0T4X4_PIEBR|nr:unnamed protein product [Pieris brassicae]